MKRKISMTILIIFVSFLAIYLGLRDTNKSNRDLYKLELKEEIKGNKFAIYVNNGGGYKEYNNKIWPNEYVFNSELSKCVDEYGKDLGNVLNFNEGTNTASVNTTQTAYCYLYFIYDITLPTCSLTVSGNDIIWSSKSDNFTESNKLKYTINTNSNNPSSYDNLNSVGIGVGTYYGYVQDEVGNIGKCEIDIRNSKPTGCSVTGENPISVSCKVTGENPKPIYCKVEEENVPIHCYATGGSYPQSYNCYVRGENPHNTMCTADRGTKKGTCSSTTSGGHKCETESTSGGIESSSNEYKDREWTCKYRCNGDIAGTYRYHSGKCGASVCPTTYTCEDGSTCSSAGCCANKTCGRSTKYSCSLGGLYNTSAECSRNCSKTVYNCSNGKPPYDTSDECTRQICSTTYTYSCSDGRDDYYSEDACTSKVCGTDTMYNCSNNQAYSTTEYCASLICGYGFKCSDTVLYYSKGDCTSQTCGIYYTYSCSDGRDDYGTPEECTNTQCGTKYTYSCSNNQVYETKDQCTSQTCGSACDAGYIQTGSYCYK